VNDTKSISRAESALTRKQYGAGLTYYELRVAGHPDGTMRFIPQRQSCGDIKNGVALAHGDHGVFVIAYDDLMEMARLATAARTEGTR